MKSKMVTAEEVRDGDRDAFARLFEQNRDRLLALAYRLTSSSAEAQDAVQDAFVSILQHHDGFQGAALPSTWAYRVTVNAALMRMRSARRKRADSLDALPADVAESTLHAAEAHRGHLEEIDPVAGADRAGRQVVLERALSKLTPLDRQIVELRLRDELSTDEVSERTGLSPSAVKTRLHRARARLCADLTL